MQSLLIINISPLLGVAWLVMHELTFAEGQYQELQPLSSRCAICLEMAHYVIRNHLPPGTVLPACLPAVPCCRWCWVALLRLASITSSRLLVWLILDRNSQYCTFGSRQAWHQHHHGKSKCWLPREPHSAAYVLTMCFLALPWIVGDHFLGDPWVNTSCSRRPSCR